MTQPVATRSDAPEDGPVRSQRLVDALALRLRLNGGQQAASNRAGILPVLSRLQLLFLYRNQSQHGFIAFFGIIYRKKNIRMMAVQIGEVVPEMRLRSLSFLALEQSGKRLQQSEKGRTAGRNGA